MRQTGHTSRISIIAVALIGLSWNAMAADTPAQGDESRLKRSLNAIRGIFGGGSKEEPPATPPPTAKPAAKPTAKPVAKAPAKKPEAKPVTTSKPSSTPKVVVKSTAKPKAESKPTAKPTTTAAPAKEVAKTQPKPPAADKPAVRSTGQPTTPTVSATPGAPARSLGDQLGMNTEDAAKKDDAPVNVTSTANRNTVGSDETAQATADDPDSGLDTPLPIFDGKWDVKKFNGHDFVSASSIQKFYRFAQLTETGGKFLLKSKTMFISGRMGEQNLLINNVKFVLSYPIMESAGKAFISRLDLAKLLDPVIRPSYITRGETFDTVVIDAGHGGHDSGARGVYGYEKDYTLQLAKALQTTLQRAGLKTIMTRSTDVFITRPGRVQIANNTPNSIFVSLHFNSGSSSASGLETYSLTPAGSSSTDMGQRAWDSSSFKGNSHDSANIALATAVHAYTLALLNKDGGLATGTDRSKKHYFIDRGVKRARWTVLTGCTRPGILFEGGFVTNSTEGQFIAFPAFRQAMANAIAQGIVNFRTALNPRVASQQR
jgi:N-acetylmuramoyl-L-alanine amidase